MAAEPGGRRTRTRTARHGAEPLGDGTTRFSVWAPRARVVELVFDGDLRHPLAPGADGYHTAVVAAPPGTRYRYLVDGAGPFADPASRSQPDGVHGASEVVDVVTTATPGWRGMPIAAQVVCEIHVGTFVGTFDGVAAALGELAAAGYTAIELMPFGEFPGSRNWGYDGVFPFAVQSSYGGPAGLSRLVDAAHRAGIAVVADVVYNHIGPEGAVLSEFGPYFTDRSNTPWGEALNFVAADSDEVRRFFIEHALYLVGRLGIDGLRLDAVDEIVDPSASPFLSELGAAVHAEGRRLGRVVTVVAESSADDARLVTPVEAGGLGLDGVWNDEFHHALRVVLTGDRDRWFVDFDGIADLALAARNGFVLTGRKSAWRGAHHGAAPRSQLAGERLVVFAQNHDQIANGGRGTRLAALLGPESQFPIAALVLCSGYVPLRFMGEEYGETAPFHYFTSHSDPELVAKVQAGRRAEIGVESPDPEDPATFAACRPDRRAATFGVGAELLAWQRRLLDLRRDEPALGSLEPWRTETYDDAENKLLVLVRRADRYLGGREIAVAVHLGEGDVDVDPAAFAETRFEPLAARGAVPLADGRWRLSSWGVLVALIVR